MRNTKLAFFGLVCLVSMVGLIGAADAAVHTYKATLDGMQAGITTPATGRGTFVIDDVANTMTYTISYDAGELTGAETVAHIHGPADRGVGAGVKHSLPGTSGYKTGVWNYSEADEADILAGRMYVNIHTATNTGGEIRGQIEAGVKINEIRIDNTGADVGEHIELLGTASFSLDSLSIVVLGDSGPAGNSGVIESLERLNGESTDANGFWTVTKDAALTCAQRLSGTLSLENSDNITYLLVEGLNDTLSIGDDLDLDNDGVIDAAFWDLELDCVAIMEDPAQDTGADELVYCDTVVGYPETFFAPGHIYVCPDSLIWVIGDFGDTSKDTPCDPNPSCANPPPDFVDLSRSPCVPITGQAATIVVCATDASSATLNWSVNGGGITNTAMTNDSTVADVSYWSASIPGQASNEDLVEYTVDLGGSSTVTSFARGYFVGTTNVSTLRVNDGNGVNLYNNYGARVTGNVTVPPGVYSTTNTDYYVQDATGGINLFKFGTHTVAPGLGDDITAEGQLTQFNGKLELTDGGDCDTLLVDINGPGAAPAPVEVLTCDFGEATEGLLIRVLSANFIFESPGDTVFANQSPLISNCFPGSDVFIDSDTGIAPLVLTSTIANITGVGGQFDGGSPFDTNYQIVPRFPSDITLLSQTGVDNPGTAPVMRLHQNYPNPFGRSTQIRYEVPASPGANGGLPVQLTVFDLQGRVVKTLVDGIQDAGEHVATLSTRDLEGLSSGIYFYRLTVGQDQITRKLMLVN